MGNSIDLSMIVVTKDYFHKLFWCVHVLPHVYKWIGETETGLNKI